MYTECPSCQTFFKITPGQLKAAGGKVRCGNCNEVFSALDGLVDVVPEDAVSQVEPETSAESNVQDQVSSPVLSELDVGDSAEAAVAEEALPQESSSPISDLQIDTDFNLEGLADQGDQAVEPDVGSMSFADVEVPGMGENAEDDIELALESAVVSEPKTAQEETKTITEQEEINQDIDAALDGLFDGNTEVADLEGGVEADVAESAVISTISELDELQDLDFGELGQAKPSEIDKGKSVAADPSAFENLASPEANETSSLSEFEKELDKLSGKDANIDVKNTLDESSFDLGDSFLDSEAIEDNKTATAARSSSKESSEFYSGDSYILEELDDERSKSGGVIAKIVWITIIILLLMVLLGQFAYLKRNDLAMNQAMKPVIENLCAQLNKWYPCEITAARDVSAIELLERNVVSHPNAKNALLITSVIENKAEFDQPYPNLVLTFSDINQKIIARRKFKPEEYLSKEVDQEAGMKVGVPVKLMLEIVDPGEEAVNFEFNFQ